MAYGTNAPFGLKPYSSINGGSWTEKTNVYYIYASANGASTYASPIFTGDLVVLGTSLAATPTVNGGTGTIAVYTPNYVDATPSTFLVTGAASAVGVFQGCEYIASNGSLVKSAYWPGGVAVLAGSLIKAYVIDDPDVVYEVQVSTNINAAANAFVANPVFPNTNSTGGAPYVLYGSVGRNFAFMVGGGANFTTVPNVAAGGTHNNNPTSGSTITGQSGFYLCVDTSTAAGYNNHDYSKTVTTLPLRVLGYSKNSQNVPGAGLTMATTPFINVLVTLNNHVYNSGTAAPVYVA